MRIFWNLSLRACGTKKRYIYFRDFLQLNPLVTLFTSCSVFSYSLSQKHVPSACLQAHCTKLLAMWIALNLWLYCTSPFSPLLFLRSLPFKLLSLITFDTLNLSWPPQHSSLFSATQPFFLPYLTETFLGAYWIGLPLSPWNVMKDIISVSKVGLKYLLPAVPSSTFCALFFFQRH